MLRMLIVAFRDFFDNLSVGDPLAVGIAIGFGVLLAISAAVAIYDRKQGAKEVKGKSRARSRFDPEERSQEQDDNRFPSPSGGTGSASAEAGCGIERHWQSQWHPTDDRSAIRPDRVGRLFPACSSERQRANHPGDRGRVR